MLFEYGETELEYLKKKDKQLGAVIDRLGWLERQIETDLFASVIHHIIGQQISMAAQASIWKRLQDYCPVIDSSTISDMSDERLQKIGISFRKVEYIKSFAERVRDGELDLEGLHQQTDEQIVEALSALRGIGVWTAEMLMIFSMQRPDVLSYGDLAIHRGMRMVYHHRKITKELFEKYRRRYRPYGTVASFYLWAAAMGQVEGLKDYAPVKKKEKKKAAAN